MADEIKKKIRQTHLSNLFAFSVIFIIHRIFVRSFVFEGFIHIHVSGHLSFDCKYDLFLFVFLCHLCVSFS